MAIAIGIDLGGTNIKGVLVNQEGEVLYRGRRATLGQDGQWQQAVRELVQELKANAPEPAVAIGLSAPGLPNDTNTAIRLMPGRLAGLENLVWADYLGEKEIMVLNDAHAALLAETQFGVAKGERNVVMLTLGTGVGGGILINGQLYQGNYQMAGHLGHFSLDADREELDITGIPGSLEDAIGNATVARRTFGRYTSTYDLLEAYHQGETFAIYVWLNSVRKLAVALCSLCNLLSPDMIVLGGGITKAGEALYRPLAEFMAVYAWKGVGKQTPVCQAVHSDMAGAVGAAGFALSRSVTLPGRGTIPPETSPIQPDF
jgi:glucokinase